MGPVGVLALQGDFLEHLKVLEVIGAQAREIRLPQDLKNLEGLIIPGGESTTISRLLDLYDLKDPIIGLGQQGMPIMGTCAGAILMAKRIIGLPQPVLGLMDIQVQRNAYGRQVDSFEVDLSVPVLGQRPLRAVFIRAPIIKDMAPGVEVLARLPNGTPAAVKQANFLALTFHPELTPDHRMHKYFLSLVESHRTTSTVER